MNMYCFKEGAIDFVTSFWSEGAKAFYTIVGGIVAMLAFVALVGFGMVTALKYFPHEIVFSVFAFLCVFAFYMIFVTSACKRRKIIEEIEHRKKDSLNWYKVDSFEVEWSKKPFASVCYHTIDGTDVYIRIDRDTQKIHVWANI